MMDRHASELVLVLGARDSGAELLCGVLGRLGFRIVDEATVMGLHERMLREAVVEPTDARPVAWARCAQVSSRRKSQRAARRLLAAAGPRRSLVAATDPCLHWFVPLWRDAAMQSAARVSSVMMVRHPAAAITGIVAGDERSSTSRTAGWINAMVYSERATRGTPRSFAAPEALVADWTVAIADIADTLDLAFLSGSPTGNMAGAAELVEAAPALREFDWPIDVAPEVRELAESVWGALSELTVNADDEKALRELDDCRERYLSMYDVAESVVASSLSAVEKSALNNRRVVNRAIESIRRLEPRVPDQWRQRVPDRLAAKLRDL